jgi:uncharacterized protein with HEPN domain
MFDKALAYSILTQIDEAIGRIKTRTAEIVSADYFTSSPAGMERLDGIAMLFMAIGESIKNLDKITGGTLLSKYLEIDWTGIKGFRDIIAHHYFDIDAEQVFWIVRHNLEQLSTVIKAMIKETE